MTQRINGGLLRSCDASQRTPPQHVAQQLNSRLSTMGGDASQRSPASSSYPVGGGSWGAAAAAVAATRTAAATGAYPHSVADAAALAQVALAAADALVLVQPVSAPAASAAAPSVAEELEAVKAELRAVKEENSALKAVAGTFPMDATCYGTSAGVGGVEVCPTDSSNCWFAGVSENSGLWQEPGCPQTRTLDDLLRSGEDLPCGEDLDELLRVAMPESYDD